MQLNLQYTDNYQLTGWNGFMEKFTENNRNYQVSAIHFLPFVYAPPSDYSSQYTAALQLMNKTKK